MLQSLSRFFSSESFMPHGHCYLWKPSLLWLQVVSNAAIGLAYLFIFGTLVYLVRRIRDIPFQWMYICFAVFIVTCGFTHFFDVYVIWHPAYWLDGSVRAVTAIASVGTALLLPPLVPKAVALAEAAAVSHQRGIELERANLELGGLLDRTKQLEQLKTEFFANVSHELRTPLALILGPVEKLMASDLRQEQRRDLEVVARNARTLLKHVNDLLDVSKLEAGRATADYEQADLAQLVRLTASNFETLAAEHSIAYVVDVPETLPAQLDSEKVQRVMLNLLSNAFKFTPAGGRIRCSVRRESQGERAVVEVSDSGPGVQPEHRALVFERFRQVEGGPNRRFGGTGLGLAIAKDFVELHGGTLSLDQAPEGGALFSMSLPLEAPDASAVRPAARAGGAGAQGPAARHAVEELQVGAEHPTAFDTAGDRPLVLVVEDNPEMNRFIRETLEPAFRTAVAFDGEQGFGMALELRPDLIVTDLMMPGSSGDELLAEVRARRELDGVPLMLLTAKAQDDLRIRLLRAGAQDYLMKPFAADELRARAENLVAMKRARELLQRELESQTQDIEALARELTGRKRELQTALESMRIARDQAQSASRLKSSFLAMVSHELRTPVTALLLQLERLRRDPDRSERQHSIIERMTASTRRLAGLIESLLQYACIESGRLTTDIKAFDVHALAVEVIEELRPRAEQKGIEVHLSSPAELAELRSDPALVRLMLTNLLENAIKFTERGSVEIALSQQGNEHRLAVRDTGVGIAHEAQAQIFEPFTQLEQITEKHLPGVGLGLALVREMAAALGGRIELTSNVGAGSTFTLSLPTA